VVVHRGIFVKWGYGDAGLDSGCYGQLLLPVVPMPLWISIDQSRETLIADLVQEASG
jgi:hypothetical protein